MTDKVKLAAIKLKGVGSADRAWILKHLSVSERTKLNPVLAELDRISFDQVLGLSTLVDESNAAKLQGSTVSVYESEKTPIMPLSLKPHVIETLRKISTQKSDVFLSTLVCDSIIENDVFLSQIVERNRHLRLIDLAKKRSVAFPPRIIDAIRAQLIQLAEKEVGDGRNI